MSQNNLKMWDSESGVYDVTTDCLYIRIDEENGVLRISDYEANGSHITTMLFIGPDAAQNAEKFDTAASAADVEGSVDLNCETEEVIRKCFGLS